MQPPSYEDANTYNTYSQPSNYGGFTYGSTYNDTAPPPSSYVPPNATGYGTSSVNNTSYSNNQSNYNVATLSATLQQQQTVTSQRMQVMTEERRRRRFCGFLWVFISLILMAVMAIVATVVIPSSV